MEFVGAADYYFWQGVQIGTMATKSAQPSDFAPEFNQNNDTTKACIEAFGWGFCLGLVLTDKEYISLTTLPEPVKIDYTETVVEEKKSTTQPKMVGNC